MGAYDYVQFACFKPFGNGCDLFACAEAGDVVYAAGEVAEPFKEGVVMLEGKDGGGDHYRYLFGVGYRFEGGADGYFGFSEAYIAADEAVHGALFFHVFFYGNDSFHLIWGLFVFEGGFEFFLEEGVGGEWEAFGYAAFGVEFYEVFRYVFYFGFGLGFEFVPGSGA